MDDKEAAQLGEAVGQLDRLADRVTAFAIGSYLTITLASLTKDGEASIAGNPFVWFAAGTALGTLTYLAVVIGLSRWGDRILARLPPAPNVSSQVRRLLLVARLAGICVFAAIWSWALGHLEAPAAT